MQRFSFGPSRSFRKIAMSVSVVFAILSATSNLAQRDAGEPAGCALKEHVYSCNGAAFQRTLNQANVVGIETHNVDGIARNQLTNLLTKKLGKTIASKDNPPALIFLLIPVGDEGGITRDTDKTDLGTLRIYSVDSSGARKDLVWAETYSGPYVPWPAVIHGLILQFQSHFHIQ